MLTGLSRFAPFGLLHFISFYFISFHFISFHFISFHFVSFLHFCPTPPHFAPPHPIGRQSGRQVAGRWRAGGGQVAGKLLVAPHGGQVAGRSGRRGAGRWRASGGQVAWQAVAGKCAWVAGKRATQSIARWRAGWFWGWRCSKCCAYCMHNTAHLHCQAWTCQQWLYHSFEPQVNVLFSDLYAVLLAFC